MSQLLKSPNPYANSPRHLGERPLSQYSDVDITEYLDESTNEYDFLPSSPLTALFTSPTPSTPPPFKPPPIPKIEENGVEKVLFDHRISAKSVTFSMPKSPKGGSGTRGRGDTIPEAIRPMLENTLKKPTYAGRLSFRKLPTSASLERSGKQPSFLSRHKLTIVVVVLVFFLVVSMFVAGLVSLHYRRQEPTLAKRDLIPDILNDIGEGTFFDVGLGACGEYSSNDQYVAALNHVQFGDYVNGAASPACGMCLEVTGPLGAVRVRVVDKCPGCKKGDIDLSPTAFEAIAKKDDGRVKITWKLCA